LRFWILSLKKTHTPRLTLNPRTPPRVCAPAAALGSASSLGEKQQAVLCSYHWSGSWTLMGSTLLCKCKSPFFLQGLSAPMYSNSKRISLYRLRLSYSRQPSVLTLSCSLSVISSTLFMSPPCYFRLLLPGLHLLPIAQSPST
jgi:hypothetical protein